ncbi:MAG: hypothetical protein K6T61_06525, partial [Bryobacteraceae bacterium]|nr:hypothetical protein [Bryobacteraceae bacterium]
QGVVSAGAFLTNVILARNLAPSDYGVYGVYLSVFLALNAVHSALITYPLSTTPSAGDAWELGKETAAALHLTIVLFAPLAALLAVIAALSQPWTTVLAAWTAAVCWQAQETTRRGLMAALRHRTVIAGDALSYLGQAVAVGLLSLGQRPRLSQVFVLMAATSLAAALWQARQLRLRRATAAMLRQVRQSAARLGGWTLASSLASLLSTQGFVWVLTLSRGPAEAASLLAVLNVLGVSHPLLFGMTNWMLPATAAAFQRGGERAAFRAALHSWRPGAALAAAMLAFLLLQPGFALRLLYGASSPYAVLSAPLRWGALAYLLMFGGQLYGCYLLALRRVRRGLWMQLAATGAVLAAGFPLAIWYGAAGACAGLALASLSKLAAGWVLSSSRPATKDEARGRKTRFERLVRIARACESTTTSNRCFHL